MDKTVKDLNVEKYMGTWYEIAKYDNLIWDKDCEHARVIYKYDEKTQKILVENQCFINGKKVRSRKAKAWIPDQNDKGKLLIDFGNNFPTNFGPVQYWVHWTDYDNAIVGGPSGKILWWLSRKPTVYYKDIEPMLKIVESFGYDADKLMSSRSAVTETK